MSQQDLDDQNDPLIRAIGPSMGAWTLLRLASAIIVIASLAGVVTRYLPPAMGREGNASRADATLVFFALHALVWAAVFVFATRRAQRAEAQGASDDGE